MKKDKLYSERIQIPARQAKKKDWILLFLPSQCLTQWNE
jgi:hypothetical protein